MIGIFQNPKESLRLVKHCQTSSIRTARNLKESQRIPQKGQKSPRIHKNPEESPKSSETV